MSRREHSWVPALQGLRAVAALAVVAFHLWLYRDGAPATATAEEPVQAALSSLRAWFIAFFVLSGALLAPHLERWLGEGVRGSLRAFFEKRARRILPAYWVAMAGALLLLWGGTRADGIRIPAEASDLWLFVVLAQNYSIDTVMAVNPPTWTLVVEVGFYVLLPLLVVLRRFWLVVAVLVAATVAFNGVTEGIVAQKSLVPYLGCFALGLVVARRREPLGAVATTSLAVAGLLVVAWWMRRGFLVADASEDAAIRWLGHLPLAAGFALVVLAAARGRGPVVAALSGRPLLWVGALSYGLFLWHVPILLALRRALDPGVIALGVLTLALSLTAAWASRRWVEQPALRPRRRRAARPPRAGRPGSAGPGRPEPA